MSRPKRRVIRLPWVLSGFAVYVLSSIVRLLSDIMEGRLPFSVLFGALFVFFGLKLEERLKMRRLDSEPQNE